MDRTHRYELALRWTGNLGTGTSGPRAYSRAHEVEAPGKPAIAGSADPAFRGDAERWNPEELLVAALAQCHMLVYLYLAATAGVVVVDYADSPTGTVLLDADGRGGGEFTEAVLRPRVTVADASMSARAEELHEDVPALCFIVRSVSFPVRHQATVVAAATPSD